MIGQTVSHFEIKERVGRGGMGIVFVGEDTRLGRPVALKFLPPHLSGDDNAKQRFIQEAKAASAINHPNICTVHEIGETEDEQLFIAMALYDGETLKSRLQRGPVPVDEAIRIAAQVADGLAGAHSKGILHRDIKPSNIMLTEHGEAVILDFGLAKLSGGGELTASGSTIGTAAYMSPEQMRGDEMTAATDVWSTGVLLYEMIAGSRPFSGEYEQALAYAIFNETPEPLANITNIPAGVSEVVSKCLSKSADDRFASALSLRDALSVFLPGSAQFVATTDSSLRRHFGSVSPTRRYAIGIGVLALIVFSALALWSRIGRGSANVQLMAVLPFSAIGGTEEGRVYSAGLSETLTSKLSSLQLNEATIRVIPASEITGPITAAEARDRLGATMVVTGSLQIADSRIRLTINIVDTKSRQQIDSRLVDYDLTSPLALQDQSLFLVAEMLRMELDPVVKERITASSSSDRFANDFYLRGQGRLKSAASLDDVDAAISLFDLALTRDSTFALAFAGLGEAYWAKYRRTDDVQWADRSVKQVETAAILDSTSAPVLLALGSVYDGRGKYDLAMLAFEKAKVINPTDADLYLRRGMTHRREGRYDAAEADFRTAISLEPGYWKGYEYLGALFWRLGQYERALVEWQRALSVAPGNADVLANIGAAYWALEDPESAVTSFERAIKAKPDHARARHNLGTAYFYQSRFEAAAAVYSEKLRMTPNDYEVQGHLADTYFWIPGRRDEAHNLYLQAMRLTREQLTVSPDDRSILGSLAYYYAAIGAPDSSLHYLGLTISGQPDSTEVHEAFGIGETYERLGMRDEAVLWISSALNRGINRITIRQSPFLMQLRKDPRIRPYLKGDSRR